MFSKRLVCALIQPAWVRRQAPMSTCGSPSITQTSMSLSCGAVDMGCQSMREVVFNLGHPALIRVKKCRRSTASGVQADLVHRFPRKRKSRSSCCWVPESINLSCRHRPLAGDPVNTMLSGIRDLPCAHAIRRPEHALPANANPEGIKTVRPGRHPASACVRRAETAGPKSLHAPPRRPPAPPPAARSAPANRWPCG